MSSDLAPTTALGAAQSAPTDADNRYKSVQAKLTAFARALDSATFQLEQLHKGMRTNADRAQSLAHAIDHAHLDPRFVEMTGAVSEALGSAAIQARKVDQEAREAAGLAHDAQRTHARLYEGLDTIRSGRRERTPKPGFLTR